MFLNIIVVVKCCKNYYKKFTITLTSFKCDSQAIDFFSANENLEMHIARGLIIENVLIW